MGAQVAKVRTMAGPSSATTPSDPTPVRVPQAYRVMERHATQAPETMDHQPRAAEEEMVAPLATVTPEAGRRPLPARVTVGEGVLGPPTKVAVVADPRFEAQAPKEVPTPETGVPRSTTATAWS